MLDPSRYTVYQMIEYMQERMGIQITQLHTEHLFLFKTEPFVNALYNYAHILTESISSDDLDSIRDFFGSDLYRIKCGDESDSLRKMLIAAWYMFKDTGYIMVAENIQDNNYSFVMPDYLHLEQIKDQDGIDAYLSIAAQAFGNTLESTREKLGFLDSVVIDPNNHHINAYILYENDVPVSTGSYYAFDMFSIENIATLPTYRGKGYAGIIMNRLMQDAQRLGYEQACLVASELGSHVYQKVWFETRMKTVTFKRA